MRKHIAKKTHGPAIEIAAQGTNSADSPPARTEFRSKIPVRAGGLSAEGPKPRL